MNQKTVIENVSPSYLLPVKKKPKKPVSRARVIFNFIHRFRLEIFAFMFTFGNSVEDVTVQLAAQDKFCMRRLNSTRFCSNLSSIDQTWHSDVLIMIKDEVLVQVTMFNLYQTLISTLPLLFTSLFLSSWADRHRKSAKILLCLTSLMFAMESVSVLLNVIYFHLDVYIMLISFIFFPMVGGAQVVAMTMISYMTTITTTQNRIKRFAILELITMIANPLGVFVGGQLIRSDAPMSSWARHNGQLHNYHHVIIVGLTFKLMAFFYALMTKFQKRAKRPRDQETDPLLIKRRALKKARKKNSRIYRVTKYARSCNDIFVIRNISESFQVCYRRRRGQLHIFIWLLLSAMTLVTMTQQSLGTLLFQFVQKAYYWDAEQYSTYNAVLYITTHIFGLVIVTPALTNWFHLSDSSIMMIGLLSVMTQNFIRGTIINVPAFCTSYLFGSVTSLVSVSVRTKLSKLIPSEEQYRLFGMLAMMETISPLFGVSLYTQIFNQTIALFPGFVFQFSCFILLVPIMIAAYINIYLPGDGSSVDEDDNDNNDYGYQDIDKQALIEQKQTIIEDSLIEDASKELQKTDFFTVLEKQEEDDNEDYDEDYIEDEDDDDTGNEYMNFMDNSGTTGATGNWHLHQHQHHPQLIKQLSIHSNENE